MGAKCEDFVMPYGKHQGESLGDILADNPSYIAWLHDGHCGQGMLAQAVAEMVEKYDHEINGEAE